MHDHVVSTYTPAQDPMEAVRAFLLDALDRGGTALVFAVSEHRDRLERGFKASGFDVAALRASGRYCCVDAEAVADQIAAAQTAPDTTEARLREILAQVLGGGELDRPVRMYGEIVAVLMQRGDPAAAISLEDAWNRVIPDLDAGLYCAYPTDLFEHPGGLELLQRVCD